MVCLGRAVVYALPDWTALERGIWIYGLRVWLPGLGELAGSW